MKYRSPSDLLTVTFVILVAALMLNGCSSGGGGAGGAVPLVPATDFGTLVAPTEREDNTPLAPMDIKSYRIYYGFEPGDYIRDIEIPNQPAITVGIEDLIINRLAEVGLVVPVGTRFVVTAVDQQDRESLFSEEVVAR